jgi:hypothetical protein
MLPSTRIAPAILVAIATASLPGLPWAQASGPSVVGQDLRIQAPLRLDAARLMAMKPGEQVNIDFPVIGRKAVVFETRTEGIDGLPYWHGRLAGNPRDRVYLKQTPAGFVGGVRFGDSQVALRQDRVGTLRVASGASLAAVHGQAYALGEQVSAGEHEIRSNLAAVARLQVGSEVALPLPGGLTEVAIVTRSGVDEHGFHQLAGISRMDGQGHFVRLTISPDAVFGSIVTPRGDYQVITRGGRSRILDPRAAGWVPPQGLDHVDAPAEVAEPVFDAILRRPGGGGGGSTPGGSSLPSTPLPQPTPLPAGTIDTTVNLLVTYSRSLVTLWETELAARTRLSNLVEAANEAYAGSGTGIEFKIVGWRQIQVADDIPQTHLNNLRLDAGAFQGTAAQKAQQGAAMTVFVSAFNEVTAASNTCGVAYIPAAYGAGLKAYRQQAPQLMFAALNDGVWNGNYCEVLSLAHELGHNFGAVHDKPNAPFQGVFPFSYGKGVPGVFGTVMAYAWPRVGLFSSPQLVCTPERLPCGSTTENVVATMMQTKVTVAGLGNPGSPEQPPSAGLTRPVSGWWLQADGTPFTGEATLTPADPRVTCRSGRTGLYTCQVPAGVSSVTVTAAVAGRQVVPSTATFHLDPQAPSSVAPPSFHIK